MMGIEVPETCWAYRKCNETLSSIYLVFVSSIIRTMHGPVYFKCTYGEHSFYSRCTINVSLHHSLKATLESTQSCIRGLPRNLFPQMVGSGTHTSDLCFGKFWLWILAGTRWSWLRCIVAFLISCRYLQGCYLEAGCDCDCFLPQLSPFIH
jgi:hypothetical protein